MPLISTGATSERYSGTICEAMPMPKPIVSRPTIKQLIVGAKHMIAEPTVKRMSAIRIIFFRPILSEIVPEKKAPIAAPIKAIETTRAI